ncbi:MAG TPA: hypothetical protein PKI03_16130 [Pseudomonadota bacterium]|nr:hypothetical protein [Pseudomonadota bacterium]
MVKRRAVLRLSALAGLAALMCGVGGLRPGYGWVDATTSATLPGGEFTIRGLSGRATHSHGGAPAQVGHISVVFENRGRTAQRVTVSDIEFLQGIKDCEHAPQKVASHPHPGGILLDDGKMRESASEVEIAPGAKVSATVGFAPVPVYYVYCDRFAFRVVFRVGKARIAVVSEVNVTRREPLRHHEP